MMAHWTYDDWKADDSQWFRPDEEPDEQPEPDYRRQEKDDEPDR